MFPTIYFDTYTHLPASIESVDVTFLLEVTKIGTRASIARKNRCVSLGSSFFRQISCRKWFVRNKCSTNSANTYHCNFRRDALHTSRSWILCATYMYVCSRNLYGTEVDTHAYARRTMQNSPVRYMYPFGLCIVHLTTSPNCQPVKQRNYL